MGLGRERIPGSGSSAMFSRSNFLPAPIRPRHLHDDVFRLDADPQLISELPDPARPLSTARMLRCTSRYPRLIDQAPYNGIAEDSGRRCLEPPTQYGLHSGRLRKSHSGLDTSMSMKPPRLSFSISARLLEPAPGRESLFEVLSN